MNKYEQYYNINNLYVGLIAQQSGVTIPQKEDFYFFGEVPNYTWTYSPVKMGIFIKTIRGYKHVLSGTYYRIAGKMTGNKTVIAKNNIQPFTQFDSELTLALTKHKQLHLNTYQIKKLEERYTKLMLENKNEQTK